MKFVFNESLLSSVGSEVISDPTTKFVSSGLILEKRIVISSISDMDDLFRKLNELKTTEARTRFIQTTEVQDFLKIGDNNKEFLNRLQKQSLSNPSSSGNKPPSATGFSDFMGEQISGAADATETPAAKFAPFLETKDKIIQRLKPFMSEQEIGEIFEQLEDKIKLPFDQVIGILDYCINKSRSCNTKAADLINFFIEHYGQKRQYSLVKNLIDQACEYQKLNPTIDVFSVLRDAVAGNQPKVNLGYLSNDRDNQKIFNNLIMLSQSSLPDDSEEVRRAFQESRDALDAQQTKFNMQRAIFDMMKIEESNKQLEKMVKDMGELFRNLITMPMYRGLRDIFYDLRAGKILAEHGANLFTADSSFRNPRTKPSEDMYHRDSEQFSQFPDSRTQFSKPQNKFLKLASPEVSRYIYSQNTGDDNSNLFTQMGQNFQNIINFVLDQGKKVIDKFKNVQDIVDKVNLIYQTILSVFKNLASKFMNKTITFKDIDEECKKIINLFSPQKTSYNSSLNIRYSKTNNSNIRTAAIDNNIIYNIIGGIGFAIIAALSGRDAYTKGYVEANIFGAITSIAPLVIGIKNWWYEAALTANPSLGRNQPRSNKYFDANGNLSSDGQQRLVNNQETMIALGIADQDAMALSKFSVQKEYILKQLRTKEENLKSAEQQIVQLGGSKTDYTVGDLPLDFQKKLKDFLDFCTKIEPQFKAALNIFRNATTSMQNLSPDQQTQATGLLAEFESDLLEIQKKKSEWSSMKNIAAHLMRKKILLQKLKPLQTQLDTMKKLGIPMANVIASPNGILAQVGKIRNEEQQALEVLRKEYDEKIELLKNPDPILPMVKYPTDTGVTKLPQSPDQSPSAESPFDVEKGSQFETQEANNVP